MTRQIQANETIAARRRVYFHLVDATDGITPETGENNGQPQISVDGGAWTNTGISVLTAIGNGRYYATLTAASIEVVGTIIETRYKSANTAECPGDSVEVVNVSSNLTLTIDSSSDDPNAMILAAYGRGFTKDIVLLDINEEVVIPLSGDKIRAYIGREGDLGVDLAGAELLVSSDAATAAGSTFTKNTPSSGVNRLRLDASDLEFSPGVYTLFVDFYDGNDANEWKSASRNVFVLEKT